MWYLNKYHPAEEYEIRDVGAVDLTPWKYRHIVSIIGLLLALGIYILFHQTSNGKHEFGNLQVINLCEKVRLVFHRVFRCAQPSFTVALQGGGIMTGCRKVEVFPYTLFKATEFDKLITHHIRIRRQPLPDFINGIGRYILPILLMQIHYLQRQTVLTCRSSR